MSKNYSNDYVEGTPKLLKFAHLHSTTRRIFIVTKDSLGPSNLDPLDLSLPKTEILSNDEIEVEKKGFVMDDETFHFENETKTIKDNSSKNIFQSKTSCDNITLQDLNNYSTEGSGAFSERNQNSSGSYFSPISELYTTPTEETNMYPITPPHNNHSHLEKLPPHLYMPPTVINDDNDIAVQNEKQSYKNNNNISTSSSSTSSSKIIVDPENENDSNEINEHCDDAQPLPDVHDFDPQTIIKEGCMLVKIERTNGSLTYIQEPKKHHLKSHVEWREYIVILRPGILELYKNKQKKHVDKIQLNNFTRMSLYSTIDYTIAITQKLNDGTKIFYLCPKTYPICNEWYQALHNFLPKGSKKEKPNVCEVVVPDFVVEISIPLEDEEGMVHSLTPKKIIKTVLDELKGIVEWKDVLDEWLRRTELKLCWKRYDRLEWIYKEENQFNILTCTQFIERGKTIRSKKLYFSSHNHHLFYMIPFSTSQPQAPVMESNESSSNNTQPLTYAVTPHLDENFENRDLFIEEDMKRRIKQIVCGKGFIDLMEVVEANEESNNISPPPKETDDYYESEGSPFELILKNGRSIKLKTYSNWTRDEWMKRLDALIIYWKARMSSDIQARANTLKESQGKNPGCDDNRGFFDDNLQHNWELFNQYIDPSIWNWCTLDRCRGITKSGILYHKSHLYGTFKKYYYVLTKGHLIYYKFYTYSTSGKCVRSSYHKIAGVIHLEDCYIYSGEITENDLLYSSLVRYDNAATVDVLPRIYSDGMCCYDDDKECTFVIWEGEKRYYFSKNGKFISLKKKKMLDTGKTWVFRARSRLECEEWVWAFKVEIERYWKEQCTLRPMSFIIVDAPNNLDLEAYIANYTGHTKVDRLLFIASRCLALQIDAYKLAIQELRNSLDTNQYLYAASKFNEVLASRGLLLYQVDSSWVDSTQKLAKQRLEKMELELKNYKNNLIKESIRMGHNDLGDHHYRCGNLKNALKSYSRTRDYCTTAKHVIDMCLNVIKVSIELDNFSHVHSYVIKAESTPDIQPAVQAKLKVAAALANLDNCKYKHAARSFLETSFEIASGPNNYSEVISPNDIAVYGGLCALASFERAELKSKVIDNTEFKQFLELEPHIRELINSFYNSKYAVVLDILERWKNDYLLDIHLHYHVETLYDEIRKKALVQYFSPFLTIDMNKMAKSFVTNVTRLEKELAKLITENKIQARIDSHKKILCAKQQDQRSGIFYKSLKMGKEFEESTNAMLLRMNLLKANLVIQTNHHHHK
ncbi:5705_t:CDS:10 [Entrophospora sp. SA101]|nr:5705_t:CDS:10 [Entrophospora sp. SA101]